MTRSWRRQAARAAVVKVLLVVALWLIVFGAIVALENLLSREAATAYLLIALFIAFFTAVAFWGVEREQRKRLEAQIERDWRASQRAEEEETADEADDG